VDPRSQRRDLGHPDLWLFLFGVQELFQYVAVFFWFFVTGEVPAFFEDFKMGSGDGLGYAPGGHRGYVHVPAAGDDQGGEVEVREAGGEIKIGGGGGDGIGYGGNEAYIAGVGHVCLLFFQ
jgi:hypothetical protein